MKKSTKIDTNRITLIVITNVPLETRNKLKSYAALENKTLTKFIYELIENKLKSLESKQEKE